MSIRLQISALIFMMVQAVLFGIGAIIILATPLTDQASTAMPYMIGLTAMIAGPVSWWIAPRLRARYWRARNFRGDLISG